MKSALFTRDAVQNTSYVIEMGLNLPNELSFSERVKEVLLLEGFFAVGDRLREEFAHELHGFVGFLFIDANEMIVLEVFEFSVYSSEYKAIGHVHVFESVIKASHTLIIHV